VLTRDGANQQLLQLENEANWPTQGKIWNTVTTPS
jgi:hypothetical protein